MALTAEQIKNLTNKLEKDFQILQNKKDEYRVLDEEEQTLQGADYYDDLEMPHSALLGWLELIETVSLDDLRVQVDHYFGLNLRGAFGDSDSDVIAYIKKVLNINLDEKLDDEDLEVIIKIIMQVLGSFADDE